MSMPQMSKFTGRTYTEQTVCLTGNAYENCRFVQCTILYRGGNFILNGCFFERCNYIIDATLVWGDPATWRPLAALIAMLEGGHGNQGGDGGGGGGDEPVPDTPPPVLQWEKLGGRN